MGRRGGVRAPIGRGLNVLIGRLAGYELSLALLHAVATRGDGPAQSSRGAGRPTLTKE